MSTFEGARSCSLQLAMVNCEYFKQYGKTHACSNFPAKGDGGVHRQAEEQWAEE